MRKHPTGNVEAYEKWVEMYMILSIFCFSRYLQIDYFCRDFLRHHSSHHVCSESMDHNIKVTSENGNIKIKLIRCYIIRIIITLYILFKCRGKIKYEILFSSYL